MGLESQHAAGYAALLGFATQKRQHGLVAPVHAIEIANRRGTRRGHSRMFETSKYLHGFVIFLIAGCALRTGARSRFVTQTGYIVT
jgi:hypothetical protein